jgi:predicted site-specific integrase-resolvase
MIPIEHNRAESIESEASMIEHEKAPLLPPGIYRIQELSERLGVARTTAERYIERFSIPTTETNFQNRKVKALILDEETIQKILSLADKGESRTSDTRSSQSSENNPNQSSRLSELEREKALLESELQAARQRIEDLKSVLDERERLVMSKDSEISTLKTALMIVERANQDKPIELITSQPFGLLGKIRQWFKA